MEENKYPKTHRYLFQDFKLSSRLIGLIGPRGVGKTTLLIQYIQTHFKKAFEAFYFSADNIFFSENKIIDFIQDSFETDGIKIFFIDDSPLSFRFSLLTDLKKCI